MLSKVTLRARLGAGLGIPLLALMLASGGLIWQAEGAARVGAAVFAVVALTLSAAAAWWASRGVLRPLRETVDAARKLMDGDLTARFEARTHDEYGQIMAALGQLSERLFKVVAEVRAGTTTVASTSSMIARDNSAIADRTGNESNSLSQTASAIEQLTGTVRQNADNALRANELVNSASRQALEGGEVVGQVVKTMGSIKESSRKIVDIISVIDSIAFQTNILALNAAVEAARAGEQGRGFAVVASEVRTLAQRSASAAKEIKSLISDSVGRVEAGSKLVDDAGRTMDTIVSSVNSVAELVREISTASHEQSQGIESVNRSITEIDGYVKANARVVNDAKTGCETLNAQAVGLMKCVSHFQLGLREHGTAEEAQALVKRGVEYARQHGVDALIDDINKLGKGHFIDRDLYLMAVKCDDVTFVAHGNNPRTLGSGPVSKDVDGKLFVQDMAKLARSSGSGWVDYKWNHPVTNEVKTKSSYLERVGPVFIACGVYKE